MPRTHTENGRVELRLRPQDKVMLTRAASIDAKNEQAARWYSGYGAVALLDAPLSLALPFRLVADTLAQPTE